MTTELYHRICGYLRNLILDTKWEGKVYAVGGCCRDEIMTVEINDLDIAVNLPGGGVEFALWLYGKELTRAEPTLFVQYGTAKLRLRLFPDDEIELVQTRREKYTDHTSRNPEVVFGSVEEDCMRRDLTINSLYFDISNDRYLDLTGRGIDDIHNHVLRTPCDPAVTFDDDPVRILRCIRFAARYDWEIEAETYAAMVRCVRRLHIVSVERMRAELEKMLLCDNPERALLLMRHTGAMGIVMPELCETFRLKQNEYHFGTVWQHTLKVVSCVPLDLVLRMAALLHDIGKIRTRKVGKDGQVHFYGHEHSSKLINKILRRLHYHSDFIKKIVFLAENHMATKRWGDCPGEEFAGELYKLKTRCANQQRFDNLMSIIDADNRAHAEKYCLPGQVMAIYDLLSDGVEVKPKSNRRRSRRHRGGSTQAGGGRQES